jgi:hypothetical protein
MDNVINHHFLNFRLVDSIEVMSVSMSCIDIKTFKRYATVKAFMSTH